MIEIKDLLTRFDNILLSREASLEFIRSAISKIIKAEINSKDIKIKNNIIYLNIKPIYKNEIYLKQDQILSELKNAMRGNTPSSVR